MNVTNPGVGAPQRGVNGGVVEAILVQLKEPEGDIHRRRATRLMHAPEVLEELVRGERRFAHAALEEVTGESRLRRQQEIGWLGPRADFTEYLAQAGKVVLVGALPGPYLRDGEAEHEGKIVDS